MAWWDVTGWWCLMKVLWARKKIVNLIYQKVFYERSFDNWKMSLEGSFSFWSLHHGTAKVTVVAPMNVTFWNVETFVNILWRQEQSFRISYACNEPCDVWKTLEMSRHCVKHQMSRHCVKHHMSRHCVTISFDFHRLKRHNSVWMNSFERHRTSHLSRINFQFLFNLLQQFNLRQIWFDICPLTRAWEKIKLTFK